MVNIAGRSKGCSTCRRRRIKCDENRPICNRCKNGGFACDGPKGTAFINYANKSLLPTSLNHSGIDENVCLGYTRHNLLPGCIVDLAYDMVGSLASQAIPGMPGNLELLDSTVRSLAITFFGRQNKNSQLVDRGFALYGSSLVRLNRALSDPTRQTRDETILAVTVLVIFEAFLPTGRNNYLSHISGLEKILEVRGPQCQTAESSRIFQGLRLLLLLGSINLSTPSLFARSTWRDIFYIPPSRHDLFQHGSLNVLADCTILRYERDSILKQTSDANDDRLNKCIESTLALMETLQQHRRRWEYQEFAESTPNTPLPAGAISQIHGPFRISDIYSSTSLMLYNTAFLYLLDVLTSLSPQPQYSSLAYTAAMDIFLCVEFNLSSNLDYDPKARTVGHLAMKTAWDMLGRNSTDEGRRLEAMMKKLVHGVVAAGMWGG